MPLARLGAQTGVQNSLVIYLSLLPRRGATRNAQRAKLHRANTKRSTHPHAPTYIPHSLRMKHFMFIDVYRYSSTSKISFS